MNPLSVLYAISASKLSRSFVGGNLDHYYFTLDAAVDQVAILIVPP